MRLALYSREQGRCGKIASLGDFTGKKPGALFLPQEQHARFKRANTQILGVSQDSIASHEKFRAKLALPFHLGSDESGEVCNQFAVIKLKKMYGKEFKGIERSTFLIDVRGVLRQEWRKVRVPGHVQEVLAAAKALA